jgi:iron complex transport system substrate-binding protein
MLTILNTPTASNSDSTRREFFRLVATSGLAVSALASCQSKADEPSAGDETTVIKDFYGPVTLPSKPTRVVAAESVTLSNLIALGIKPIGAAVNRNSLPHYLADQMVGVEDVTADEGLDLEKALSLEPDLIITSVGSAEDQWDKESYEKYKAAVATFGYTHGYTYIEELQHNVDEIARAVDRRDRARELMRAYEDRTKELKERVRRSGLTDTPVSVVRLSQDANYSIRIGTSESIAFRALGITQPEGQRDPDKFSIEFSLERLAILNQADTVFVYVDDNASAERAAVVDSPLWRSLEPVRRGRVHFVNSGVWNSIDIPGLMVILDDIEKFFLAPREG